MHTVPRKRGAKKPKGNKSLASWLRAVGKLKKLKLHPEILLHPNIPEPLHGLAPRVILGTKWWNKTRKAAYRSTAYRCIACGVQKHQAPGHRWLEAHEVYRIDHRRGTMTYLKTVPLCHYCHSYIHSGRLRALLEAQQITHQRYAAIMRYGDKVLARANLPSKTPYDGPVASWNKWRLVLNGKRYKPLTTEPEK